MIVCICRAISDRQIRSAVSDGAQTVAQVRAELGCAGDCGKCAPQVRDMIVALGAHVEQRVLDTSCACAAAA